MGSEDLEVLKQKILYLENNQKDIDKEINKFKVPNDEEVSSYRLFMKAKEHFVKWLSMITLGISAIGIVALINLYLRLESQIQSKISKSDEQVTREIEKYIKEGKGSEILNQKIVSYLNSSAFQNMVKSELENQLAEQEEQPTPMFFVIAGSSTDSSTLRSIYLRAKHLSGDAFGISKHEVKICNPKKPNNEYALIIGSKNSLSQAQQLVAQAIADNFVAIQTSTISESFASKSFDIDNCEIIQNASIPAILTRHKMNLRIDRSLQSRVICSLNKNQNIEVIEQEEQLTKIKTVCPNQTEPRTGFIFNYEGQRPYRLIN